MANQNNAPVTPEVTPQPVDDTIAKKLAELEARLAASEKENADLKKAVEKAEKAEKPKAAPVDPANDPTRLVEITLFQDNGRYKDPLYVSVNGYNAQIPRGVKVNVPFYVAKHIDEMLQQDSNTAKMITSMVDTYAEKAREANV